MHLNRKRLWRGILFSCSVILFLETTAQPVAAVGHAATVVLAEKLGLGDAAQGILMFELTYEEKLAEAEKRRQELEKKKSEVEVQIQENEKKKADLLSYIEELDRQIIEQNDEIERLEEEIRVRESDLTLANQELDKAQKIEEKQYEAMKKRIQYMYESGESSALELFIGASGLADLLNRVEYQKRITEYDEKLLADYTAAKLDVEQRKRMIEADLKELSIMKETAEFDRATLEQLASDKSAEIEVYLAQLEIDEDMFADYAEQITREEANIEEIKEEERKRIEEEERKRKEEEERRRKEEEERKRKAAEAAETAAKAKAEEEAKSDALRLAAADYVVEKDETDPDKMIWPLPGDGRIYSFFGPRKAPTAGASTYHRGLDIGGVYGARIVSVLSGTVTEATYNASRGNYVAVDHGNGLVTYYMHCSKLLVTPGDKVKQGTVIGLIGSTGISTGPHVHFSITVNGTYVDPLKYVSY